MFGAVTAGLLAGATAPNGLSYLRRKVRSVKESNRISPWADQSMNPIVTFALAGLVAGAILTLVTLARASGSGPNLGAPLVLFIGATALVILQAGFARQLIRLRWPRQDLYYSILFILIFWGLPVLLSLLVHLNAPQDVSETLARLSAPMLLAVGGSGVNASWISGLSVNGILTGLLYFEITRTARQIRNQVRVSSTNSGE